MTRVLLALALILLAAGDGPTVSVWTPVQGSAGFSPQRGRPGRPAQARSHEPSPGGRCVGDLEDGQESQDQGLAGASFASGAGPLRRRPPRRLLTPTAPNLLFAAPKTGPPTLHTLER